MRVCIDKVCEGVLCEECKDLVPSICGNRFTLVFAPCYEDKMLPSSRCLKTELHIGEC